VLRAARARSLDRIAGPYATKLLCDLGADVLKVEEPLGDPLRRRTAARVALPEGEDSALFRFLNSLNYLSSSSVSRIRFWSVQIPRMGGELCSLQGTGAVMHRC